MVVFSGSIREKQDSYRLSILKVWHSGFGAFCLFAGYSFVFFIVEVRMEQKDLK